MRSFCYLCAILALVAIPSLLPAQMGTIPISRVSGLQGKLSNLQVQINAFNAVGSPVVSSTSSLKALAIPSSNCATTTGYYAVNDGGAGNWVFIANDPATPNNGTIIASSAATGNWYRVLSNNTYSAKWFGAKGDGATDDTAPIQNTLNALSAAGGGTLYLPSATYKIATSLSLTTSANIKWDAEPGTVLDGSSSTAAYLITFLGTGKGTEVNVTANATKGTQTLVTATSWQPGQVLLLSTDQYCIANPTFTDQTFDAIGTSNTQKGEFAEVESVTGPDGMGNYTYILKQVLQDNYPILGLAGTQAGMVYPMTMPVFKLYNVEIKRNSNNGGLWFGYARDVDVENCKIYGARERAFRFDYCYGGVVNNCYATDAYQSGGGTNYTLDLNTVQNFDVTNCRFLGGRCVTVGGFEPNRFIVFANDFIDSQHSSNTASLSLHGNMEYYTITGCTLGNGSDHPGRNGIITNNTIISYNRTPIYLNPEIPVDYFTITGNRIIAYGSQFGIVYNPRQRGMTTETLDISHNTINAAAGGIEFAPYGSGYSGNVVNHLQMVGNEVNTPAIGILWNYANPTQLTFNHVQVQGGRYHSDTSIPIEAINTTTTGLWEFRGVRFDTFSNGNYTAYLTCLADAIFDGCSFEGPNTIAISSPYNATASSTSAATFTFPIPAGNWTSATWQASGTAATTSTDTITTSPSSTAVSFAAKGATGSYINEQIATPTGQNTDIQAAEGGTLTVTFSTTDTSNVISSLQLLLVGKAATVQINATGDVKFINNRLLYQTTNGGLTVTANTITEKGTESIGTVGSHAYTGTIITKEDAAGNLTENGNVVANGNVYTTGHLGAGLASAPNSPLTVTYPEVTGAGDYVAGIIYGQADGTDRTIFKNANTNTGGSSMLGLGETADSAVPFYIRRYGSTSTAPGFINIFDSDAAAMAFYTNSTQVLTLASGGGMTLNAGNETISSGGITTNTGYLQTNLGTVSTGQRGLYINGTTNATDAYIYGEIVNLATAGDTIWGMTEGNGLPTNTFWVKRNGSASSFPNLVQFDNIPSTGDMEFMTANTERFRLDASGNVSVGTAALATNATNGFLYVPTSAGAPSGTPTSKTGLAPVEYDSTNKMVNVYSGGWKASERLGLSTLTYGASVATDASTGPTFTLSVTDGNAFTISNPTNPISGETITYIITDNSGGVLGVVSWGAVFKIPVGGITSPAAGKLIVVRYVYDGSNWDFISQSGGE